MIEKQIEFPKEVLKDKLQAFLEKNGLSVGIKTTLKSKRNAEHWHLKFRKEKGILEITFLTPTLFILSVHENRNANWIANYLKEDFWKELNR